jgi:hypothetical protein
MYPCDIMIRVHVDDGQTNDVLGSSVWGTQNLLFQETADGRGRRQN